MQLVNTGILKHPLNWLTVSLMVLIAWLAVHQFVQFHKQI